ncbi:MAG: hypothetical protein ACYTDX_09110 [Planctomycetota bacterium]|jgi:hypothetical protein
MLVENLLEWKKNYTAEAIKEGEARLFTVLLETKFGSPLPAGALERIRQADAQTLMRWGRRLLNADRLEAVFADADG